MYVVGLAHFFFLCICKSSINDVASRKSCKFSESSLEEGEPGKPSNLDLVSLCMLAYNHLLY